MISEWENIIFWARTSTCRNSFWIANNLWKFNSKRQFSPRSSTLHTHLNDTYFSWVKTLRCTIESQIYLLGFFWVARASLLSLLPPTSFGRPEDGSIQHGGCIQPDCPILEDFDQKLFWVVKWNGKWIPFDHVSSISYDVKSCLDHSL